MDSYPTWFMPLQFFLVFLKMWKWRVWEHFIAVLTCRLNACLFESESNTLSHPFSQSVTLLFLLLFIVTHDGKPAKLRLLTHT